MADVADDIKLEAGDDAASEAEAPDSPSPESGVATSCLEIFHANPMATTGRYTIAVDGTTLDVHCDMALAGGGWTAFYVGQLGDDQFAHFDLGPSMATPVDDCPDTETRCLRHLPGTVTSGSQFAAICGADAIGFSIGLAIYGYLRFGIPNEWAPITALVQLAGAGNPAYAAYMYTGNGDTNHGWILSSDDADPLRTSHTFASAYDSYMPEHYWDFCNGVDYSNWDAGPPTNRPMVYLLYR